MSLGVLDERQDRFQRTHDRPDLEASGGLNDYLGENNYLDFGSTNFAPTTGVWMSRP